MEKDFEFYHAIKAKDLEKFKALASGVKDFCGTVHPYHQSLLLHAALNGSYKISKFLIEHHCNVNEGDEKGYTPLHGAAEYDYPDIAKLLIENNSRIDHEDVYGNTPLLTAVFHFKDNLKIIDLLLKNGADPFHENKSGVSPYSFAAKTKKKKVIDFFDEKGFEKMN